MTPHSSHHTDSVWVSCATCWGQRRILTISPGGRLEPNPCPGCLGIGERLVDGEQVPAAA